MITLNKDDDDSNIESYSVTNNARQLRVCMRKKNKPKTWVKRVSEGQNEAKIAKTRPKGTKGDKRAMFTQQLWRAVFLLYRPRTEFFYFFPYLPLCTILQDKLHSFKYYIQDDRSTRFFCTTNYSIDHFLRRFLEKNSMPGLFIEKNRTGSHFSQNQICTL